MREPFTRLFGIAEKENQSKDEVKQLAVHLIQPSPYQPRTIFDDDRIEELCQSIRTHGVIQPIVIRSIRGGYELIAGERRLRAVKKLGIETIPAIVREMSDTEAASASLIENLQREGLTAIEEAIAYQKLIELHELTQESLAQRLGKGQSTVANKLRLLHLPEEVRQALMRREITERHARALLVLKESDAQMRVLAEVIEKELNVKQTEERIRKLLEAQPPQPKKKRKSFSRDVRIAMNTIRQSVDMVKDSGLAVTADEQEFEDFYEVVIRIPK
ncbi:chromosome partitioning protein, ParB family [Marininema mesophilum]|uniref:Chromosome partitioning protein, ParB family n=1 Tax=Marininema mesophilum TaxID=1048340 RepID=A0A1H3AFQ8_9BACL|nr:nucleoid occlusion protein [Marininema mesophilum]SDX28138.1 chromosome partitioning protein, ParB family [Marininema mesophilum]